MGQREDLAFFYAQLKTMGTTERYREATLAECYYLGKQYDDLPGANDKTVPFAERRPSIIIPLFKEAVDEIVRFTWGGHNFPAVAIEPTRGADGERADEIGPRLDKDQAERLTRFVRALVRAAQLPSAVKEASRLAAIGRSAALILGVRAGYVATHCEPGKHCTPTWDPNRPRRVKALDITYQYPKQVEETPGRWKTIPFWYKRVIDEQRDVTYQEVRVIPGMQPNWVEDPARTVVHGLGLCPVVWFKTLSSDADQLDGAPLIDPQLYPLIDDVNRSVSQRSRAVRYVTDPQPVVSGLEEGEIDFVKNPGRPIYLPDAEAKVQYLEMTGVGVLRATEHAKELTEAFRAAVHYVKANPDTMSGNISGVVLEFLHAPMISLASDLRVDFGDNGFSAAIAMLLQITSVILGSGQDIWVQGAGEAVEILAKAQLSGVWLDPPITIRWPPFFPETEADKQARVGYSIAAEQGRLISAAAATRQVAPIFGIEDIEAERDQVDKESLEAQRAETASYGPTRVPREDAAPVATDDEDDSDELPVKPKKKEPA